MVWSGKGWCREGLSEELEPRQSCYNRVFSHKLLCLQLEEEQNTTEDYLSINAAMQRNM